MTARKAYSRDSLERALIHHGIDYSPPEPGGRKLWRINTGLGWELADGKSVHWYVLGLADKERGHARARSAH